VKEKEKTKEEEFQEAIRDLNVSWITKLDPIASKKLYEDLKSDHNEYIPLHLARLQALDNEKERPGNLAQINSVADTIISAIDQDALLAFYGIKNDSRSDASKIKSNMDKQRNALVEALSRKGCALYDLYGHKEPSVYSEQSKESIITLPSLPVNLQDVDMLFSTVQRFVDLADPKVMQFTVKHCMAHRHHGRALKVLFKQLEEKPTLENENRCLELFRRLNWTHCYQLMESTSIARFPPNYRLF